MFEKMIDDIRTKILEAIERYLKNREEVPQRITGLIPSQQLMKELDIKYTTLQRWEKVGLKRYQPPLEDTRKAYYKVTDIWKFLGVENDNL